MYREERKAKCPACQRPVAAVREITKDRGPDGMTLWGRSLQLKVSRHLYQETTDVNGIGLPILNADGFCPGSFSVVNEDRTQDK